MYLLLAVACPFVDILALHLFYFSKTEKYLYLSASLDTLLRLADAAELEKMTTTGSMQKFNHGCVSDFLLPGMTKEQILTYCETPVLIKDVIEPPIRSYIQKGYIEDMFPLHDIVRTLCSVLCHHSLFICISNVAVSGSF